MKFRKARYYLIAIALILFLLPQSVFSQEQSAQTKKSFLWEVQSQTTRVYILGSIHFMKKEMYPLRSTIEDAFTMADYLVVEVNTMAVDQNKMQAEILRKGMYQGNKTVKDDLSEDVFAMLKNYLEKNNIPMTNLMKFKPGMIVMTLESMRLMKLGYVPEYGIDMHFLQKAHGVKQIFELETIDEQLNLLLDNSMNDNLIMKSSILEWEQDEELMEKVISLWMNGSADKMADLIIKEPLREQPDMLPFYKKFFFDRNAKMADKIKSYLASEQIYFVVVGSGHLIGEKGIIQLLKKEGYTITQL